MSGTTFRSPAGAQRLLWRSMGWQEDRAAGEKGGLIRYACAGDHRFYQQPSAVWVKFYGAGHGAGIKPIVGKNFNVRLTNCRGDELTHLTVLAANNTGYQNLTLLTIRKRISAATARQARLSSATGW